MPFDAVDVLLVPFPWNPMTDRKIQWWGLVKGVQDVTPQSGLRFLFPICVPASQFLLGKAEWIPEHTEFLQNI
jgi:hypothetical protein